MPEEVEITISGYETIYCNDETSNSEGIIIAIKDAMKTITMQLKQETEVGYILWTLLNNKKKRKEKWEWYMHHMKVWNQTKNLRNVYINKKEEELIKMIDKYDMKIVNEPQEISKRLYGQES